MANTFTDTQKKKVFYEDSKNFNFENRYKMDETFKIKTEVLDFDRDICRDVVKGGFTIDNKIRVEFMLYSTGGIIVNTIEDATEEQKEIYAMVIRRLHDRYIENYEPNLLELRHKFADGKVTCFVNEFIDIDKEFSEEKYIDKYESYIQTRVFYTHDNGIEEDISHLYNDSSLERIIDSPFRNFRDLFKENIFYMMCRTVIATEEKKFELNGGELEYYLKEIKNDYSKIRYEVNVYKLTVESL